MKVFIINVVARLLDFDVKDSTVQLKANCDLVLAMLVFDVGFLAMLVFDFVLVAERFLKEVMGILKALASRKPGLANKSDIVVGSHLIRFLAVHAHLIPDKAIDLHTNHFEELLVEGLLPMKIATIYI